MGHLLSAKLFGMRVEKNVSIGFPSKNCPAFKWKETEYLDWRYILWDAFWLNLPGMVDGVPWIPSRVSAEPQPIGIPIKTSLAKG